MTKPGAAKTASSALPPDFQTVLRVELVKRQSRNPRFSQTAFARLVGLSAGRLSEVLAGKQGLSITAAKAISQKLELSAFEAECFVQLVASRHARGRTARLAAADRLRALGERIHHHHLAPDRFRIVSEWYHFAILELVKTCDFKEDVDWIARRLKLPRERVAEAVERLVRARLLSRGKRKWTLLSPDTATLTEVPCETMRKLHRGLMGRASTALSEQSMPTRDFVSLVLAIDRKQIGTVKSRITAFWRALEEELSMSSEKTDVYCLGVQCFNLTPGERDGV